MSWFGLLFKINRNSAKLITLADYTLAFALALIVLPAVAHAILLLTAGQPKNARTDWTALPTVGLNLFIFGLANSPIISVPFSIASLPVMLVMRGFGTIGIASVLIYTNAATLLLFMYLTGYAPSQMFGGPELAIYDFLPFGILALFLSSVFWLTLRLRRPQAFK